MTLQPGYFAAGPDMAEALQAVVAYHGGNQFFTDTIGAVMVGIPAARRNAVTPHLEALWTRLGFRGPVIDYRRYFGEFASASAVAAAAAMAGDTRWVRPL